MTTLLLASIVGAQAQKLDGKLQKVNFNQSALTMARKIVAPGQVTSQSTALEDDQTEWETWYLNAYSDYNAEVYNLVTQVSYNTLTNKIYLKGLCPYIPSAVVEGTLNSDYSQATFASGQYYGIYDFVFFYYHLYFVGSSDIVFDVDFESGVMSTEDDIYLGCGQEGSNILDRYYDVVITREPAPYGAPTYLSVEDVTTNSVTLTWQENSFEEVTQWVVRYSPLVVTSVDENGNKTYDLAENGALLKEIVVDEHPCSLTNLEEGTRYKVWVRPEPAEGKWSEPMIFDTKATAVPAVPADPIVSEWYDRGDESGYSRLYFTLPETDVDGNEINKEYLSYSVFTDDDQIFTFPAENYYRDFSEDMTEIPYEHYASGHDFFQDHIYFYRTNYGDNPFFSKRIGMQVYYTVGSVKNASNIVYWNLPPEIATGIHNVTASESPDTWYTLDGRKLSAKPMTKGVFIKNGQKVVNK